VQRKHPLQLENYENLLKWGSTASVQPSPYPFPMPNHKKHITVGATVGGAANLAWQLCKILDAPNRPKDFWELLSRIDFLQIAVFALGGAACAALPDIIEPATNPNHRAAFHSLACAGAVSYGAFGEHTNKLSPEKRHALQVAALSYLSHLFLDGQTPKSLPFVGLPQIEI
jgi:membrane-bound metal-dependent hydrolase YbcI (DUF457 family)